MNDDLNSSATEFKCGPSMSNQLVIFTDRAPALVAAEGAHASYRFFEFFTANIRNPEHAPRLCARPRKLKALKRLLTLLDEIF